MGHGPVQIQNNLRVSMGKEAPSLSTVKRWIKRFLMDGTDIYDLSRPGQPRVGTSEENINKIQILLAEDNRLTLGEFSKRSGVPPTTVWRILKFCLRLVIICAKWIPKVLSPEQMKCRVRAAKENLYLHSLDPELFEGQIVTGDETWVHHYEPETKRQSMQWLPSRSDPPKKALQKLSKNKVLLLVFWDRVEVILVKFLRKGATMTGLLYSKILKELKLAIIKKRGKMWDDGVFLLHDNAPAHTSNVSQTAIKELGFIQLTHPPYSPDLAPSDYFLFSNMKKDLRKIPCNSDDEVEKCVKRWLLQKPTSFFNQGISRLSYRWKKCIKVKGQYVE